MQQPVVPRGKSVKEVDRSVCAATRSLRRKRAFIQEIKMERGCECPTCKWIGDFSPEMLALDHKGPASKNPRLRNKNFGLTGLSWSDLIQEIGKCRIVCHNCHIKHTVENGHHKSALKE